VSAPAVAPPTEGGSALAVFRNRPFLLLWLSQLATQVGGNMVLYGLTVLVFDATGSNTIVSLLILTFLTPAVIFSALAGVYVDRFDRRKVLVVTNLVRAALFVALALVDTNIAIVLVLNVAVSIATTFFAPAELSMIPLLVPRGQLIAANGIFMLTMNAAFAIGFAVLGPLLVIVANPTALILVVAVLYLVAAVFCWTLPPAPPGAVTEHGGDHHEAGEAMGSVVAQLREGISYVRANPVVSWGLLYLGVAASIVGILGVLGPGFATDVLGLRSQDFVVVVLPLGVGVVTGALAVNLLQASLSRRRLIEIGLIVLGVALALITIAGPIAQLVRDLDDRVPGPDVAGFISILTVVVAIAFVAGIAYAAVAIPAQTELQSEIPPAVRGRVFGILNMLVSVGSFLPIIVVGPVSDVVGPMPVVLVASIFIIVVGVASVVLRRPVPPDGGPVEPVEVDGAPAGAGVGWMAGGAAPPGAPAADLPGPSPDEP